MTCKKDKWWGTNLCYLHWEKLKHIFCIENEKLLYYMIQPFKNIMQAFLHMHFIQFNMYKFCANILDMIQFFSSHNPIKEVIKNLNMKLIQLTHWNLSLTNLILYVLSKFLICDDPAAPLSRHRLPNCSTIMVQHNKENEKPFENMASPLSPNWSSTQPT